MQSGFRRSWAPAMDLEVAKPTWYLKQGYETHDFTLVDLGESTGEDDENMDAFQMGAVKSWTSSCQSSEETRAWRRAMLSVRGRDSSWMLRSRDLKLKEVLGSTLKNTIYLAAWQGADVVVKCASVTDGGLAEEAAPTAITDELLHEIDVLSSMRHPDLVMFLGACIEPNRPIMCVTEFMPKGDLEHYYETQRKARNLHVWRPGLAKVVEWSCAVARALNFLHSRKMIHRDLKPMNLLLTKHHEVKVADFGISRMLAEADDYNMTGGIGTTRWMAPEVMRHMCYDEKVDIYAFGLIVYFMSSGRIPFHHLGLACQSLREQFRHGGEPRPLASECSPRLRPLMEAAWHVDPTRRPTAEELSEDLRHVVQLGGCGPCAQM
ncbi:unnamed protein product [Symbiodinium necroappetens]|uniref:Protein kinase domain-containing protein n=1 Tax=Symbiodinium necroappetens TaxID=1628268 RepID=A0A813BJN4_9DINO|nr:unnamed protein product [Symbiodinium necroappetens]